MIAARVTLSCGCVADVDHLSGDRLVVCDHGREHVVTAHTRVVYTAAPKKEPASA